MPLILASSSPYRRALLQRLGLEFACVTPAIDESRRVDETPLQLARRLSLEKARAVAATRPDPPPLIIGSDQVASVDGQILPKSGDHATARRQLRRQSGREVTFLTAVCLLDCADDSHALAVETATVRFRDLSEAEIDRYLEREQPWDCAGSFRSEGYGVTLVEAIDCADNTALIGLPLIKTARLLRAKNYRLP